MFNMDFYLLNVSRTFLNSSRKILFCSVVPIDTLRCLLYPQPPQGLTITPTLNNISAISPASYGVLKNTKLACDGKHSHPNFVSLHLTFLCQQSSYRHIFYIQPVLLRSLMQLLRQDRFC